MAQLHYWGWCDELLGKPHLLIAGSTGSGKSVLINSIMYTLLTYQPNEKQVMLIDPKRVELYGYKRVPHCIGYASETPDIIALLRRACEVMDQRYTEMQKEGKKLYEGSDIYVVIDEFADVEWARIPHFYNAFYVYQYATGFSSAVAIAERILNHDGAVDYLKFLSSGGSDYPIEELKLAGVDLTRPEPVRDAMRMFAESLDALEALLTGREA